LAAQFAKSSTLEAAENSMSAGVGHGDGDDGSQQQAGEPVGISRTKKRGGLRSRAFYVVAQERAADDRRTHADRILPLFLVREMPTGLAGLLLASIVAVAMSNASGSLNSLPASSVLDFAKLRAKPPTPPAFNAPLPRHDAPLGAGTDGIRPGEVGPSS